MKKKVLAWVAAVAIVALVSAAFLRPAGDFGFADKLYTPSYYGYEPVQFSGDTHLIEAIELGGFDFNDVFPVMRIRIKPADDAPLLYFGLERLQNSNREGDGYAGHVLIERKTPDGLEYVAEVDDGYMTLMHGFMLIHLENNIFNLDGNDDFIGHLIDCPIMSEPGEYVFTLRFRTCELIEGASRADRRYTASEELYSVSFPVSLPSTNAVADVASVRVYNIQQPSVTVGLRCNEGTLYLDLETIRLEQKANGVYEPITLPDGSAPIFIGSARAGERYVVHDYAWRSRDPDTGERIPEPFCVYPSMTLELGDEFDPEAEYRLTLEFVENADGSGERYTLPLRVRFSEEGQR